MAGAGAGGAAIGGLGVFSEIIDEVGDLAQEFLQGLQNWVIIDRTVTKTRTLKATKRLAERTETTVDRYRVTAFDLFVIGILTGVIVIVTNQGGRRFFKFVTDPLDIFGGEGGNGGGDETSTFWTMLRELLPGFQGVGGPLNPPEP